MNKIKRKSFKVGDRVRIISGCSGNKVGDIFIVTKGRAKEKIDNGLWAGKCNHQDYWESCSLITAMVEKLVPFFLLSFNHSLKNELKLIRLGILKGDDASEVHEKFKADQKKWKTRVENFLKKNKS